jgi:hypothetical protein
MKKYFHMDSILRRLLERCKWWGRKLIEADTYNFYKTRHYNSDLKGGPI